MLRTGDASLLCGIPIHIVLSRVGRFCVDRGRGPFNAGGQDTRHNAAGNDEIQFAGVHLIARDSAQFSVLLTFAQVKPLAIMSPRLTAVGFLIRRICERSEESGTGSEFSKCLSPFLPIVDDLYRTLEGETMPLSGQYALGKRIGSHRPARHAAAARRAVRAWPSPTATTAPSSPPRSRPSTTRGTTPAHAFNDGQNYHPTNKWVLFGHHFAAISGAGPLIGPVLAIQYGYMPGLLWLVIGVCLAGAVQDMLVLAASVRRGGKSLAEIARAELGRSGHRRRLGGDPVHRRHRPGRAGLRRRQGARRRGSRRCPTDMRIRLPAGEPHRRSRRPAWPLTVFRRDASSSTRASKAPVERSESFHIDVRSGRRPDKTATMLHQRHRRSVDLAGKCVSSRPRQFLGHVHHRLHHPDRPVRRPVHVPHPQGADRRGVADRRRLACWRPRSPATGFPARRWKPYFSLTQGTDRPRPGGLRLHRLGAAGVDAALPARLPVELPQDRHHRSAGRRRVRRQPDAAVPDGQHGLLQRRADLSRRHLSRSCSSASCAGPSPASTPWCRPARRRR